MKITQSIRQGVQRAFASAGESFSTWATTYSKYRAKRQFLRAYRGIVMTCIAAIAEDVAKYEARYMKKTTAANKAVPNTFMNSTRFWNVQIHA
jgi:phage portal protein BeeE